MAITIDDVKSYYGPDPMSEVPSATGLPMDSSSQYNPDLLVEAESRLGSRASQEQKWNTELGLPPMGRPLPTIPALSTTSVSAVSAGTMQPPEQVAPLEPAKPTRKEGWLRPTGNVPLDIGKGMVAGVAQAVAGEIDTIDWLANKIADVIPGLGRQEVIGKIRDAIKPGDLDKDEETLTYIIGNAIGYGAAQFGLLYAMIFKPLQGAKLLSISRLKDAPRLFSAGGRAAIKAGAVTQAGEAGLQATMKAAPLAAKATELWGVKTAAEVAKKGGIVARGLDKLGNVHLAGPVGLGIHGAITGAKEGERGADALAGEVGRDATTGERLRGAMEGFTKGGTQGFMMGTVLGLLNNFSQIKRSAAMGTVFGGMSMMEGSDVKRGFADFLTGALMGYMPAKAGEKWPWQKSRELPPSSPSEPGVDASSIEDLVTISQAANVNLKTSKGWAKSMGYTEQEAALRMQEAEEWYGPSGEKTTRPFIDPDLGLVLKRGSKKGDSVIEKTWEQIRKKHSNHLEAALEMGRWAQGYKKNIGIDDNPFLGGLMDNVIYTLTRDAKGYSPVGSAYIVPSSAFSGKHSAGWAGNIYREIARANRTGDTANWSAIMSDGTTVPLAESTGSRLSKDGKNMYSRDGDPMPIEAIRAIVNDKTGIPLVEQPQKTVKDIRADHRVAEKAAEILAKQTAAAKKVEAREAKKLEKATASKAAVTQPSVPFKLGPDRANAERMIKEMEARAKKGEDVSKELEVAKADLAESGAVEEALAGLQGERDALKNSIEKVLSPEQKRLAGERLSVFEEELLAYWKTSAEERKGRKGRIVSKVEPERPTEQAIQKGVKLPLEEAKILITEYDQNILKIKSKSTPKEEKGKVAIRNQEINDELNSRQGYQGKTAITMQAIKKEIAQEKPEFGFKPYEPTEPKSIKTNDLEGISKAFNIPLFQIEQILSPLGAPKPGSPELIPYVLERQMGFTKQQAKLISRDNNISELIFDGAKGDGTVPFTAKDFFIGDMGEIKPISAEANRWFKSHIRALEKRIPDLTWPEIEWLTKVEGKPGGQVKQLVEYWTLNDMAHSLDMLGQETFRETYQRDLKSAPGISSLPKDERYIVKVAELITNHKFSDSIFGTPEQVKAQVAAIAKSTGRTLSDQQLGLAANWIAMQNLARDMDPVTGRPAADVEARKKFGTKWKRGEKEVTALRPITINDVGRFFQESQAKEWGEVADMANELAKATNLPLSLKDNVDILKSHIKELEDAAQAFGLKYGNLQERVKVVKKIKAYADRIKEIKNSRMSSEVQDTKISKLNRNIEVLKNRLPTLRGESTPEQAAQEEWQWGTLRRTEREKYPTGKITEEGELEAFTKLATKLSDAYSTLENVKYVENPVNWVAGERRLLRTPDGEPLNLVVGSGKIPAIGPLQAASMEASLRRAAKKYYVDEINGFTSGVSTTIGYKEEIAPGLKVPKTGSMTGEYTLDISSGVSPETRQIRREMLEEALAESKLTPEDKVRVREHYWQQEANRIKSKNLLEQYELEMAAEMDKELEKLYASDLSPYGPDKLGVTPPGTTRQVVTEPRMTPEQYALQKKATAILQGAPQPKEFPMEAMGVVEGEVIKKLPSGKMEHPKVAGAKEETLTKSQMALEPVTIDTPTGPQVVPGQFRVIIFQEALTQKELNIKKEGLAQAKIELKTADRKPTFYPEAEAEKNFPWLTREELQKEAPKKVWRRVETGFGPEGKKLLSQKRVELLEGKREIDKVTKQEKITTTGKADIVYTEPDYPTREFEPGYMVSDRDVISHDIRRLKAEILGTTIIQPRGKLPVIMDGNLSYVEAPTGKGLPNKLVWKFTWNGADPERLPPGDPREIQLARNAERIVQNYLTERTPMPYTGETRTGSIEYEFAQTDKPTILEQRAGKVKKYRQDYKDKYGVEYTGEPLTTKVFSAPILTKEGKGTGRWTKTDINMSKAEMREERRRAAIIDEWQRREDVMKMTYTASKLEKQVYRATGRVYDSLEKQAGVLATGAPARTGKTPAELRFKVPKGEQEIAKANQLLQVGEEVENIPAKTRLRLKEVKKEAERTTETPETRDTQYRQEFVEDLTKVPTDVRDSLLKYRRDVGRQDVVDLISIPRTVYGLKGYGEKIPEKRSEARNLMQRQLETRLGSVRNVERLATHLDSLVLDYEKASYEFDSQAGVERDFAAGRMNVGLKNITQMMELLKGRRYAGQDLGIKGPILSQAKNWLTSYDEAATSFKVKLGEERFGVNKKGNIVDLEKKGEHDLIDIGKGFTMEKALAENEGRLAERDRIQEKFLAGREPSEVTKGKEKEVTLDEVLAAGNPEISGIKGGPGEQRWLKKPETKNVETLNRQINEADVAAFKTFQKNQKRQEQVKPGISIVNGKKMVLPNASSKEVEHAIRAGIKFSKEANENPSIRNKIKETEIKLAMEATQERPPVQPSRIDKDQTAKKVVTHPVTQEEILQAIKTREDYKRSSNFMTEAERIALYNHDPVRAGKSFGPWWEKGGQFSQSSVPEKRLLGQGAADERISKIDFLRKMIYDETSPMKKIRNLATKIQNVKDGNEGLEKTAEYAMYKREPTDPAMKEIFRIIREDVAPGFAKAWDMKGMGTYVDDYTFPLVVDMNKTFAKSKERYNVAYRDLDKVKGGDTLQALTNEKEWAEIRDIFNRRDFWHQSKVTPHSGDKILNSVERDLISRTIFQWFGGLDDFRYMPAQKKAALKMKDSFNEHLQHRSENKDFLAYKHNFADVWESYIYDMSQINYINNIKKLATPLLNAYPDKDVPLTTGWEMTQYMRGLFGSYSPMEKWLAKRAEALNERVGREVMNPAFAAKGLAGGITGQVVKGAIGMVDSSIRQITDHTKLLVDDPTWGKLYFKSLFEFFTNLTTKPGTKGLGEYFKYWDAFALGRESFEGAAVEKPGLRERLGRTESIPRKLWTLYDWIGEKALVPFGLMEHFNKGVAFIFNVNKMKYEGADWSTACQIGLHSASTQVPNLQVPFAMRQVLDRTLESQIGYTKEHRSPYLGLNPLTRISTTFWSYPGDMIRKVGQGVQEGWRNRHDDHYSQFARYVTYIGFQTSIAAAIGALGYDVGATFGAGLFPVKPLSVPLEMLYMSYKSIDPGQYIGKPQYLEEERQKALDGMLNAMGILFVPQYRWGKSVVKNLQSLEEGYKQNLNGRDIMEWSVPNAIMTMIGAPPIENSETYNLQKELDTLTKQESAKKQVLVKEGVEALKNRDSTALAKVREKAKAKGIPVSYSDIHNAYRDLREVTVLEKEFKKIPKHLRPQYKARIEELKGRAFPGGEYQRKFARNRNMWSNVEKQEEYSAEEEE